MKKADYVEAATALQALLAILAQSAKGNTSASGANLTYGIATVVANISTGVAFSDLKACFSLATLAGATFPAMLAVYTAAVALAPAGAPAKLIRAYMATEATIQGAVILNATTFTSRDDVDAAITQIGAMFEAVESIAGNALQTSLYRALVTAHGATTTNLTSQSYPLPRLVTYTMGKTFNALALAYRLYGDASRAGELAAENKVFNPAFMPLTGEALSA